MNFRELMKLAEILSKSFNVDTYPEELKPWNVIGRKAWRRDHTAELIADEFATGEGERENFLAACRGLSHDR